MFATTLATPLHDSRSRPHSRLLFATPNCAPNRDSLFLSRLPSCDSTTDGRTVLTPQRHLPSVPTLTLLKKTFFGTYSLAWPPPLATTHHHVHPPPSGFVSPDTPFGPTPLQRPLHLLPGPLPSSPPLSHPLNHPLFPLFGSMSLMF